MALMSNIAKLAGILKQPWAFPIFLGVGLFVVWGNADLHRDSSISLQNGLQEPGAGTAYHLVLNSFDDKRNFISAVLEKASKTKKAERVTLVVESPLHLDPAEESRPAIFYVDLKPKSESVESPIKRPDPVLSSPFDLSYLSHTEDYPFDEINFKLVLIPDVKMLPLTRDVVPASLFIQSSLKGFDLKPGDVSMDQSGIVTFKFSLVRNWFLQIITLLLMVVCVLYSIVVVRQFQKREPAELPLVTFFAAIWGVHSIILEPIVGDKPFPIHIDLILILLFIWTLTSAIFYRFRPTS